MFTHRFSHRLPLPLLVLIALVGGAFAQTETIIDAFDATDGSTPWAGMIFDNAGNLYGTASSGGSRPPSCIPEYGCGTVWEIMP
jgi:hypothetical protein